MQVPDNMTSYASLSAALSWSLSIRSKLSHVGTISMLVAAEDSIAWTILWNSTADQVPLLLPLTLLNISINPAFIVVSSGPVERRAIVGMVPLQLVLVFEFKYPAVTASMQNVDAFRRLYANIAIRHTDLLPFSSRRSKLPLNLPYSAWFSQPSSFLVSYCRCVRDPDQ